MCIIVHPNVHHAAFLFLSLQIVLYVLSNLISITTLSLPYECRYVSLSIPCLIAHLYLNHVKSFCITHRILSLSHLFSINYGVYPYLFHVLSLCIHYLSTPSIAYFVYAYHVVRYSLQIATACTSYGIPIYIMSHADG